MPVLLMGVFGAAGDAGLVDGEAGSEFSDMLADALLDFGVADIGEHVGYPGADLLHFRFAHTARGDGGRAEANAAALHGWKRIERDGVFVDGDARAVESFFGVAAGNTAGMDLDEEKVIVRSAA